MYNPYNFEASSILDFTSDIEEIIQLYKSFLIRKKISGGSIRSYLSDVRHFLNWLVSFFYDQHFSPTLASTSNNLISLLTLVNERLLESYKSYLTASNTPLKTINRRFSSLRGFGNFCQLQCWFDMNPFDTLKNISEKPETLPEASHHLEEFKNYLWKNKMAKLTIKNYLADAKQFITWMKELD